MWKWKRYEIKDLIGNKVNTLFYKLIILLTNKKFINRIYLPNFYGYEKLILIKLIFNSFNKKIILTFINSFILFNNNDISKNMEFNKILAKLYKYNKIQSFKTIEYFNKIKYLNVFK